MEVVAVFNSRIMFTTICLKHELVAGVHRRSGSFSTGTGEIAHDKEYCNKVGQVDKTAHVDTLLLLCQKGLYLFCCVVVLLLCSICLDDCISFFFYISFFLKLFRLICFVN